MMDMKEASVLITGGGSGIGRSFAQKFLHAGSQVLITGRNEDKLKQAAKELPGVRIATSDIGKTEDREKLAVFIRQNLPALNFIINNAGIQRRIELAADNAKWEEKQVEIDDFISGPIHLNHLLIPLMLAHKRPSIIVNITSRGAYIPQVWAPIYSASKAALHSYTLTLRDSLQHTNCRVVEVIPPPIVGVLPDGTKKPGVPLETFVEYAFNKLKYATPDEIGFGTTANLTVEIADKALTELFEESADSVTIKRY